jgi:Bacterial Ig-like domain (group 3)
MKNYSFSGSLVVSFIVLGFFAPFTVCAATQGKTVHYVSARIPAQGPGREMAVDGPAEFIKNPPSTPSAITLSAPVNNWQLLASLPSTYIEDISFPTPLIGYAAAEVGQVWKTTDGGLHWFKIMDVGFPYYWYGVQALSANDVIISGFIDSTTAQGIIRWSHDGGATWTGDILLTSTGWLHRVRYSNSLDGLVLESPISQGAPPNAAHYTGDGGATAMDWTTDVMNPKGEWFGEQFSLLPNQHVRASGFSYCDSTNGGVNWSCRPPIDMIFDGATFFVDDNNGWVGSGAILTQHEGWVHRTTDGGKTWSGRTLDISWPIRELRFLTPQFGWAAGGDIFSGVGGIYFSNDGGQTWSLDVDTGSEMRSCDINYHSLSNYQVWCAGYSRAGSVVYRVQVGNSSTGAVNASPNPSVAGQPVVFSATISAPAGGAPTGTVDFRDGNTVIAAAQLDIYGMATASVPMANAGVHSITVGYNGDANHLPVISPVLMQTVNPAGTMATVSSSPNPSTYGQVVAFTATVAAAPPGAGVPTGTIQFKDGGTNLGPAQPLTAGAASYAAPLLSVGPNSITAVYSGDANFLNSTSDPLSQTVNKAETGTALITSTNPSPVGQSITFTATVSATVGGTPTGTVDFKDGATTIAASQPLDASGTATFLTAALTAGPHSITAIYNSDAIHAVSTSPVLTQVINNPTDTATTVALAMTVTPLRPGQRQNTLELKQSATLTATVTPSPGANGTIVFTNGTATLETVQVSGGGIATLDVTQMFTVGQHTIQAIYTGGGGFQGNLSTPLIVLHSPRPK